jgi:hypothetical protein
MTCKYCNDTGIVSLADHSGAAKAFGCNCTKGDTESARYGLQKWVGTRYQMHYGERYELLWADVMFGKELEYGDAQEPIE